MILDTNAVSGILLGEAGLPAVLERSEVVHIPVIVIGEYLFGIAHSSRKRELSGLFLQLLQDCEILGIDAETARQYAAIRGELKASGRPIPENDLWIAALSRQHGLPVLSRDAHFDHVPRLRRITWRA